jgi:hypothetical protein
MIIKKRQLRQRSRLNADLTVQKSPHVLEELDVPMPLLQARAEGGPADYPIERDVRLALFPDARNAIGQHHCPVSNREMLEATTASSVQSFRT